MTAGFEQDTNWCVITGAPSSGKTSVVVELARRGYAIQDEVARELIEAAMRSGESLEDIRGAGHAKYFQRHILVLKQAREKALDPQARVFMDRGMPDSITYYRLAGLDPALAVAASRRFRYRAVFMLDRLPLVKDGVRTETEAQAAAIGQALEEDYKGLGYVPVHVPVLSIQARADFILSSLA